MGTVPTASRELLQGPWRKAPPEVKGKYADFFAEAGFEVEASMVRATCGVAPATAGMCSDDSASSAPGSAATGTALVKALQAMRSARGIQNAWRAHSASRGESAGSGSGDETQSVP